MVQVRLGLRFRMAASYVVISAAAVLVVEAVLLSILVPRIQSARDSETRARQSVMLAESSRGQTKAQGFAVDDAAEVVAVLGRVAQPGKSDQALLAGAAAPVFGSTSRTSPTPETVSTPTSSSAPDTSSGSGISSGSGTSPTPATGPGSSATKPGSEVVEVLATVDGQVVASTAPGTLPIGTTLPSVAIGPSARTGVIQVKGQAVDWAVSPVSITGSTWPGRRVIGVAYAQVVAPPKVLTASAAKSSSGDGVGALLVPGVIVLALLLPVGALFGLASTGRLIRRIRRLAEGTTAMAGGDLKVRIPVAGADEVAVLEQGFNAMAEQLQAAVRAERERAESTARRDERTRIARELHDSISQDLFSVSLLAGGLRRALPSESGLRRQAESMEHTLERTMREMRAMMLELRPVALEDLGLAAALDGLCEAYEVRLGLRITTDIGVPRLKPQVELAVLRVVQEALGNAVRHGRPEAIELRVAEHDGQVSVLISDDGQGFDEQRVGERHGMGLELMRERVNELGGTFELASTPEQGTTVRVLIPEGAA